MALNKNLLRKVLVRMMAEPPEKFFYGSVFGLRIKANTSGQLHRHWLYFDGFEGMGIPPKDILKVPEPVQQEMNYYKNTSHACGTTACVAGFVAIETNSYGDGNESVLEYAARVLRLDEDDAYQLFNADAAVASRDDAIARIKHLLKNGSFEGYDSKSESWSKK